MKHGSKVARWCQAQFRGLHGGRWAELHVIGSSSVDGALNGNDRSLGRSFSWRGQRCGVLELQDRQAGQANHGAGHRDSRHSLAQEDESFQRNDAG